MTRPLYSLSAFPEQSSELKNIFSSDQGTVMKLLENPGTIRYAGWDLETLDTAKIVRGEYLQVKNGDRKLINMYKDGTVVLVALADNTFLAWGRAQEEFLAKPRLNQVALIEVTYNFVKFLSDLLPHFVQVPESEKLVVELKNTRIGNTNLYLNAGELHPVFSHADFESDRHPAPENNVRKEISASTNDIKSRPAHVAYKLIELVYTWFEIPTDKIPYVVKDELGTSSIDVERIKKLG